MIEVFRNSSLAQVSLYGTMLEDAGIATHIRNECTQQNPVTGLITMLAPIFIFWPTLCVVRDEDYPQARKILAEVLQDDPNSPAADWTCAQCGENVPGNFEACWKCQAPRA